MTLHIDTDAVFTQTYDEASDQDQWAFPHEKRWDLWRCSEEERPKPGDSFPAVAAILERLKAVREAATRIIDAASETDLRRPIGERWKSASDPYMRTIWHTMAHVRQIWLLRGALGLTDGMSWPQQHWA